MNIEALSDISKLFLPLIAIIGLYIAWQQFVANREKIRLDLYDRRFKIYDTIIRTMYEVSYGAEDLATEVYSSFFTACDEAQFLLPQRICEKVDIVRKLVREGKTKKIRLRTYTNHETESEKVESLQSRIIDIESEIEDMHTEITSAFKEVLKFEKFNK